MIDGNQLREEFGRYLAEHKATRWGMDAALMHVCKIAYDAGKADAVSDRHEMQAAGTHPAPCARHCESAAYEIEIRRLRSDLARAQRGAVPEPEHRIGPASDSDTVVYQSIADGYARDTAPAPAEVPMPQGYVERPTDYTGDIWIESQMRTYGAACRAAGEAAGYAQGLKPRVPLDAINKMLADCMDVAVANGANSISMPDHYVEVAAWVCGVKDDALRGEVK